MVVNEPGLASRTPVDETRLQSILSAGQQSVVGGELANEKYLMLEVQSGIVIFHVVQELGGCSTVSKGSAKTVPQRMCVGVRSSAKANP